MAGTSTENQAAQRQSGTGGFGVATVSSIPCGERETHRSAIGPAQSKPNYAVISAWRCSTRRITRAAVSSIESSVVSITGHPSRRCTASAFSSSS